MNIFLLLLGIATVLCGIGVLAYLALRGLAHYQKTLDDPALDDWAKWDAYQGNDPEIAKIKKRWEKPKKKKTK